ncbi:MAG: hypothetical protein QM743_05055 [Chitinophagaceae bacterium]
MAYYIEVELHCGVRWQRRRYLGTEHKRALKKGADIIIATPGRLISLINMKAIDFSSSCSTWCWMKRPVCLTWDFPKTLTGS